jgi:two-component system, LytTR family, response regulator
VVLKTCILDDEALAIAALGVDIKRRFPEIEVVATFQSPIKALEFIKNGNIDLLFLDIDMPEMNGLTFLETLGHFNFDVVFTTAYDSYALAALKLKATDYLLKPIDIDELSKTIENIKAKKKTSSKEKPLKIALTDSSGIEFITLNHIMYCVADKNYTTFYVSNGSKKIVSKNLGEYEKILDEDTFVRIHQSNIININFVTKITKHENSSVIMQDGNELSVSRAKKNDLLIALQKLT